MDLLKTNSLTFSYGTDKFSLKSISCGLKEGEFISVIGRNGSGKSTLIKLLCRIYTNYMGEIFFKNQNIKYIPAKEYSKSVSYLPQSGLIFSDMFSVRDILLNGRYPYKQFSDFKTSMEDMEIVEHCSDITRITPILSRSVMEISGGERQKVFLALSLVQLNPLNDLSEKAIIVDEPLTFLDLSHQLEIFSLLKKLSTENGLTVISVIHDLNYALKFADRVMLLDKGKLIKFDTAGEVINSDTLRNYFMVESEIHNFGNNRLINILN